MPRKYENLVLAGHLYDFYIDNTSDGDEVSATYSLSYNTDTKRLDLIAKYKVDDVAEEFTYLIGKLES